MNELWCAQRWDDCVWGALCAPWASSAPSSAPWPGLAAAKFTTILALVLKQTLVLTIFLSVESVCASGPP